MSDAVREAKREAVRKRVRQMFADRERARAGLPARINLRQTGWRALAGMTAIAILVIAGIKGDLVSAVIAGLWSSLVVGLLSIERMQVRR